MKDLLRVENLTVDFGVHEGILRAVDNVSFSIQPGGTLALVGESGSGKSVCSQAIMGLLPRTATVSSGSILFADPRFGGGPVDIAKLDRTGPEICSIRGGQISIIFQEPMTSLSALHTVGDQIGEAVELHGGSRFSALHSLGDQIGEAARSPPKLGRAEIDELTRDMPRMVGSDRRGSDYPFELAACTSAP
jgi:peptide/nickel transport system ATP-binding protein